MLWECVVSKKGKNDTDKIKFFKIDEEGSIASAVPGKDKTASPVENESSILQHEPHIMHDEGDLPEIEISYSARHKEIENEIEELKPQVEQAGGKNEVGILKKYISLKEAEVADLKDQHKQYQTYVKKLSGEVKKYKNQSKEIFEALENARRHEESMKREIHKMRSKHEGELSLMRNDYEEKLKKSGNYQTEFNDLLKKKEEWKEKIKEDLKRIKLKERELENKYELLKRDTQALLDSKDRHLLELKNKNDAFELEMESLEDRLRNANALLADIEGKKRRLVETMKLALSLIEGLDENTPSSLEEKRKAG